MKHVSRGALAFLVVATGSLLLTAVVPARAAHERQAGDVRREDRRDDPKEVGDVRQEDRHQDDSAPQGHQEDRGGENDDRRGGANN